MKPTTLNIVLVTLALALLMCLGLIGFLASAEPARSIPDVLVAVPTGILGLLGGLLVPSRTSVE